MSSSPTYNELCEILKNSKTIVVFGISRYEDRTSREIADFLLERGYNVIGVNPSKPKIDNIPVYEKLEDIDVEIDIVDVFRRSKDIPFLIPDVLKSKPKVLWLQLGISNDDAVEAVRRKGITVVQNTCIKIQYLGC